MKKSIAAIATILIVLTVLAMPVTAFANSAQRRFEGVTGSGAIVTTENCPITVTAEKLTFNITSFPPVHGNDELQNYNADVTAEYDFYNPADYLVKMQLVFPFGRLPYYDYGDFNAPDKYTVYVDGNEVERTVRATYTRYGWFDLENDIAKMSDEPILYKGFADDTVVYKYNLKNELEYIDGASNGNYKSEFVIDGLTLLVSDDSMYFFGSVEEDSQHLRVYGRGTFTLYSIGQPLSDEFFLSAEYSVEVPKTSKYSSAVAYESQQISGSTSVASLSTLTLGELLVENYTDDLGVSQLDYRNAVVNKMSDTDSPVFDMYNIDNERMKFNLMYWYQYNVTVPSKRTVTNKVVAPLYPDVNMDYSPAKYTYEYLLSPASSWASFANLDVIINTTSYMLSNSLDGFTKTDNGYTAHFDTLPNGELKFALCDDENPKYNSYGSIVWMVIFLVFILPAVLGLLAIVAAIVVPIVVVRKRKNGKQQSSETTSCIVPPTEQEDATKNKEDNAAD